MRRYELVSGAFFSLLALVQLTRVVLGWPVQVAAVSVPVWVSVLACLVAGSFAFGHSAARGAPADGRKPRRSERHRSRLRTSGARGPLRCDPAPTR